MLPGAPRDKKRSGEQGLGSDDVLFSSGTRWGRRPSASAFSKRWDLAADEDEARAPEKKEAGAAAALHGATRAGGCSRRGERCRAWG